MNRSNLAKNCLQCASNRYQGLYDPRASQIVPFVGHSVVPQNSRKISQWLQLIPPWLLISSRSSHFLSLLGVQPTPFSHYNILQYGYNICYGTKSKSKIAIYNEVYPSGKDHKRTRISAEIRPRMRGYRS
jgi:hypothetical protein